MRTKNKKAFIEVKGARVHNLKGVDMLIPKNKMVGFTGVSGSGKSSLLFSTIYEEARARYLEALLPPAFRTFRLKRPDVDYTHGLLPPIATEQKTTANLNPRSTAGASTEVPTFLRMLFARIGQSPGSGDEQLTPAMFSFNTHYGMCERCSWPGEVMGFDIDLIIPDRKRLMRDILGKAVIASGTPEAVAASRASLTGRFLKKGELC
jgi:excinuclease ABC subunit A